jgi:cytolysin (calcineurin-like family phosphatase)
MSRRRLLAGASACAALPIASLQAQPAPADVTFVFINDVHACRTSNGLSPNCFQEGKTDENLVRHVRALNNIQNTTWPIEIDGKPSGLSRAGERIDAPRGIVVGGDATDDGGGQTALPEEGAQLLQFSQRYEQGPGDDQVHVPVYVGLGNHDLDQDGPAGRVDWYRRELRDYVEFSHRPGLFFKPLAPADSYDVGSDSYSWNWGGLHLVQLHRFGGDVSKGAASALGWLAEDLASNAEDGRPVVLFQHYGWDVFSIERWDPAAVTFDDHGSGAPHWWSEAQRQALLDTIKGYNVIGIFHGHQHETPMIYRAGGYDLFKPKAAYMGGFALIGLSGGKMDVVLAEAAGDQGGVIFTHAFSKPI